MSSLYQMIPFNNTLVKKFLNWKQGDEDDNWRNKAFDTLVKKLKKSDPDCFRLLELVLTKKTDDTPCIPLSRSQDGRLQVSHRKMLPHVMYCRIFRWPDLQSQHELKSISGCSYPANKRDPKVCVNPYHYVRVEHSVYPPVVTPRNETDFTNASPPPQSPSSVYSHPQGSPNYFQQTANITLNHPQVPQPAHYQTPSTDPFCYITGGSQQTQSVTPNFGYQNQSPLSEANYYNCTPNGNGTLLNVAESPRSSTQAFESQSPPPSYRSRADHRTPNAIPMDTAMDSHNQGNFYGFEDAWCKIQYSELTQKVGEPFKSGSPHVFVDGFTNPSTHDQSRFSLGVLSNINRNSTIEMTRRAIRRGICLENIDGQVFVRNMSDSSIFFHSKNCNVENQLNQHAVVKIEPQKSQKIFDPKVFQGLVQEAIQSPDGDAYQRLYSLIDHCIIKMSFVKGWGSIYQRQDVTSTPCWIEIYLLKAYEFIDRYLQDLKPPSMNITSTS